MGFDDFAVVFPFDMYSIHPYNALLLLVCLMRVHWTRVPFAQFPVDIIRLKCPGTVLFYEYMFIYSLQYTRDASSVDDLLELGDLGGDFV